VFLFDGDCAFCSSCARFIERRIPTSADVLAWQFADLDGLGVTRAAAEASVVWVDAAGSAAGPDAISRLLRSAGGVWRPLGELLRPAPVRWVAWPVYRWISRNRHRLPGGTAACSLSQHERDRLRAESARLGEK
jgi:predicted DCC family thiol-disulfide oxidoreductase YuxK